MPAPIGPRPAPSSTAAAPTAAASTAVPTSAAAPAAATQPVAIPSLRPLPSPGSLASGPGTSAAIPSAAAAPGTPERRPINPFLANDPNQKAKRLARALVSDMLAYHPGKRDEGLANGTLKQIFRDEIKKSYEEYVEQIGRDFAENSTHFQDALNELLAAGKKMF
jgi:hypothetical protein